MAQSGGTKRKVRKRTKFRKIVNIHRKKSKVRTKAHMKKSKARTRVHRKKMKGGANGELSDGDKKGVSTSEDKKDMEKLTDEDKKVMEELSDDEVLQYFMKRYITSQNTKTKADLELSLKKSITQLYKEINKGAPVGEHTSCPLPAENRAIKVLIPTLIENIRDNPGVASKEILKKTIKDITTSLGRGGKNLIQKGGAIEVTDVIGMGDMICAIPIIIVKSGIEVFNLLPKFEMDGDDEEVTCQTDSDCGG